MQNIEIHQATGCHGDVVMTSLCTSQRRRRYVSIETPNEVSMERRQDVSVVRLHDVLLVCCDDVSRGRNDNVQSVRLHDISGKSQMKHPTTSLWLGSTSSQSYVVAMPCLYYFLLISNGFVQRFYIGFPGYLTVLLASDFYFIFLCCGMAL